MFTSLVNLFFPKVCYACHNAIGDNEDTICVACRNDLPVTNFHFNDDESVIKVLYGRAKIEHGTASFRFEKKGLVQQLIHGLNEVDAYHTIDIVIPVPLHEKKLKTRGYNQVAKFGQQIAKALDADYKDDVLVKITNTKSQTTKGRFTRWTNSDELFALKNMEAIDNKHILLVDDIITTGATLEACINVLNQVKNIKISIATMAIA
mgnify:CR=1 FL=1